MLLDARAIGLAASLGHLWLAVRRRPRVGLLATGNELRWPGETPEGSQIASSNTITLGAMLSGWGAEPVDLGICPDDGAALAARVREARGLDLLATTGGASVGDYDLVQDALGREGMELDFWKIAMRPGKPLLFGRLGPVPILGFPGNPVSTAVCALVFLRAALQRMFGLPVGLRLREVELANPLPANDQRQDYLRANYVEGSRGRRVTHCAPPGQLDAGDLRSGRRAGRPRAVRPGATAEQQRGSPSISPVHLLTCGRKSTTCAR